MQICATKAKGEKGYKEEELDNSNVKAKSGKCSYTWDEVLALWKND